MSSFVFQRVVPLTGAQNICLQPLFVRHKNYFTFSCLKRFPACARAIDAAKGIVFKLSTHLCVHACSGRGIL